MKACPQCGEASEAQFDSCWRCGCRFDGVIVVPSVDPRPGLDELVGNILREEYGEFDSPEALRRLRDIALSRAGMAGVGSTIGLLLLLTGLSSGPTTGMVFPAPILIAGLIAMGICSAAVAIFLGQAFLIDIRRRKRLNRPPGSSA